mgnify:CR=1 FL=1
MIHAYSPVPRDVLEKTLLDKDIRVSKVEEELRVLRMDVIGGMRKDLWY